MTGTKQRFRIAIIGCGRIAPYHASAIAKLSNASLIATCDIDEQRARSFGSKYNIPSYSDYLQLLSTAKPDVVSICTPSYLHVRIGKAAAARKVHVICEKPLGVDVRSAQELVEECEKNGVKLCCCFQNRFNGPVQELKRLLLGDKLGRIYTSSVVVRWKRDSNYYNDSWHGEKELSGGGALITQAIHFVDLLRYFLGRPETGFGYCAKLRSNAEVEDAFAGVLKFPGGQLATIEASTVAYDRDFEASIALLAEKGSVKIGGVCANRKEFWHTREDVTTGNGPPTVDNETDDISGTNHHKLFADFLDSIVNNREPLVSGSEGVETQKIIEALYLSSQSGKEILF